VSGATEQPGSVVASILRQGGEQLLMMSGWIGEHPDDRSDVAHLILYPAGHGVADKMRVLADVAQLARGDAAHLPDVDPDAAALGISREGGDVWAQLYLGGTLAAERPITEELAAAAEAQRWVILTMGQDPWDGRTATLDRYLGRTHRLHLGRVPLASR
jgi:hypothetical protein